MTTTLPQAEARIEQDPLRILTIAANLLPAEIIDARRGKKFVRLLAGLLVILLIGVVAWDVHARQQTSSAQRALNDEQSRVSGLQKQARAYSELTDTKNSAKAITDELAVLMASDLQWWNLIPELRATAPVGVSLTNVSGGLATGNTSGTGATTALPGITSPSVVGTITISGNAPDKQHVATFVDALGKVPGLASAYLNTATVQTGNIVQFTVTVEITSAALGGRYSTTTTANSGGH